MSDRVDRAATHSHAVRAMPESDLADAIFTQELKAEARRDRFVASIIDKRTGQRYETTASDAFLALDKLRYQLGRPHVVLGGREPEVDPWTDCP